MKETSLQTHTVVEMVGERGQLLLAFCGELTSDKEMLRDTLQLTNQRSSFVMDAVPILGAYGRDWEYEQGTGRIRALNFKLPFKGSDVTFSLPVDWRRFQAVLLSFAYFDLQWRL